MKYKRYSSRRKTPWDNSNLTTTEKFIKDKYEQNYEFKHPKLMDTNEEELINSIEINCCPHCESSNIRKYGKTKNRINRYYCNNCRRTFNALTNTIFDGHKIAITEWIEFLLDIFNYGSTMLTSKVNKNSSSTTNYWLHKIFLVLHNWQKNIILNEIVYIDEMFYSVIKSDIKTKDGKKLRGLSRNQHCIGIGYDGNNIIAIVEGLGKTSTDLTWNTFSTHIKEGSKIIHDDEKSHKKLIRELQLVNEQYNSLYLKKLSDKDNPLRPINHQCDLIRQFLNMHSGFDRKNLQDYLNLYCFMNSNVKDKLEKVNDLLLLALTTKVNLKYRDFSKTVGDNNN